MKTVLALAEQQKRHNLTMKSLRDLRPQSLKLSIRDFSMNNEPANKLPSTVTEDDVLTWIEAKVDQLHAETRVLVDDYWRRLKAEQKNHALSEKARIGVRVRRREASFSFSIEWFRMAMIRENGLNKPIARYLKKGSGYHYPLGRLLQGEPNLPTFENKSLYWGKFVMLCRTIASPHDQALIRPSLKILIEIGHTGSLKTLPYGFLD
jgi:hypothetical protein